MKIGLFAGDSAGDEKWRVEEGCFNLLILLGGRGGIRTRDLRLRRPTLYPAELPARFCRKNACKVNMYENQYPTSSIRRPNIVLLLYVCK